MLSNASDAADRLAEAAYANKNTVNIVLSQKLFGKI